MFLRFLPLMFLLCSCASSKIERGPQSTRVENTQEWVDAMIRNRGAFEVSATMPLRGTGSRFHNSPYAVKECVHDRDMYCNIGYAFNLNKPNPCQPKTVGSPLLITSADRNSVSFNDPNGYHVGVSCFRKSRGSDDIAINAETLFACGVFKRNSATTQDINPPAPQAIGQ